MTLPSGRVDNQTGARLCRKRQHGAKAAFTLVELLVGLALSLMVMTAVLATYVKLGRNFTRSLGLSSANQPNLESQARRTIEIFTEDVRMATGISGTPSGSSLILILPTSSGTTTVAYSLVSYDHDNNATTADMLKLIRTPASGTAQTLHLNLLTCVFRYYDNSGNAYNDATGTAYNNYTDYMSGIKQLSITFTSQAGTSINGTLTQVYETDSPRLLIRNKDVLP